MKQKFLYYVEVGSCSNHPRNERLSFVFADSNPESALQKILASEPYRNALVTGKKTNQDPQEWHLTSFSGPQSTVWSE